jgi:hypothetical protein
MARVYALKRKSTLALRQRKLALLRLLAHPPRAAVRASVVERFGTCGKAACACHTGAKHGPYYYLTQCVTAGHVRKFLLKTAQEQQAAREAVGVFNQFYNTLEELSQINVELLRRGERLSSDPSAT